MTDYIRASTIHIRRGALHHAFRYTVDYVLIDPDRPPRLRLLSFDRFNLWSVRQHDHGGERRHGRGAEWFRDVLRARGAWAPDLSIRLLTQPGFLWFRFNPVSFWIAMRGPDRVAIVAEVNSTFGQRHCYVCAHPDLRPITPDDRFTATKQMHVSPFQQVAGAYRFRFNLSPDAIDIRIDYENGGEGVIATLTGARSPATDRALLSAALRRPFGGLRVLALIHWQAARLWLRRAPFLRRQPAPATLVSDGMAGDDPR